jgi:hypothetical protein
VISQRHARYDIAAQATPTHQGSSSSDSVLVFIKSRNLRTILLIYIEYSRQGNKYSVIDIGNLACFIEMLSVVLLITFLLSK